MIIRSRQLNVPILFPNEEVRDRGAPVCELESDDTRRRNGSQSGGEGFNAKGEAARGLDLFSTQFLLKRESGKKMELRVPYLFSGTPVFRELQR